MSAVKVEDRLVSREDESQAEILREDQAKINEFSKLNARREECKDEISALEKERQALEDAGDELLMQDDETIKYRLGDCYVYLTPDQVEERLGKATEAIDEEITVKKAALETTVKAMNDLKVALYAKFGKSINLETDD